MNYDIEIYLIYITLDFYQQETVEVNEKWYISVKGTTKAYIVKTGIISYHIRENTNIFNNHVSIKKSF